MRTLINVVIISVSLFLFSSCKDDTPWAQYNSKAGGFSVFMPAKPVLSDKKIGKQNVHYVTWRPTTFALNKFKLFEVSYTDYPDNIGNDTMKINTILDSAINQRKKDFTDLDVESQPISINGYRARVFFYDQPRGNTLTTVKELMVGNRRYDLTVIAKKDYPTNTEMDQFFNSFQVLR